LKNEGKEVSYLEGYDPSTRDFKGIVSKIADVPLDILFTASAGETSALFTRQLFSNPKTNNIPVIGDINFANPDILQIIGPITAPICAVDNYMNPAFEIAFREKYGHSADALSLYGYMTISILKQALDEMNNDYTTDDVYNYIRANTFETNGGTFFYDSITIEPNLNLIFKETLPNE
jgi:ABC-type branched-subunit amino acid transport system substrate-binding protein